MPLISVGMPLYNAEKYIAEALDCILRQSHGDLEVVISDNCSTDRTLEIVEEYARQDPRVKIHQQPENLGPLKNFQYVIDTAQGEYFIWRSYDDWSDDDYLEQLAQKLDQNDEVDLVVARLVQDNGTRQIVAGRELDGRVFDGSFKARKYVLKASHASWMYGMFRRDVGQRTIANVLSSYPHVWAWDYLVLFPIVLSGRIATAYETTFFQRETGISSSVFRPKSGADQVTLARNFYSCCYRDLKAQKIGFFAQFLMACYLFKFTSSNTEKFSRTLRIILGLRKA